jgi:TonB family protein
MDDKRTRRLLIVAFALSLLVHLILSGVIRWPLHPSQGSEQIVHVAQLQVLHVMPPPHTPKPVPSHAPPVHRTPVHVARVTAVNPRSNTSEARAVLGTATPQPTLAPTATPDCSNDTPVQLVSEPPAPEISPDARGGHVSGITQVRVVVNASGGIESANVVASSGSDALDLVAVGMAKDAQYAPAMHACKAIASDYTFSVRFIAY